MWFSCVLFFKVLISHEWIYFTNGNKCCPMWKIHKYLCSMCFSCRENLERRIFYCATQGSLEIAIEVSMVVTKHFFNDMSMLD